MAMLSIMGLYNYDPTVLDGLINNLPSPDKVPVNQYPDTYVTPEALNSDDLINLLMLNVGELEIYPTNFDTTKTMIASWAAGMNFKWQKLYNTMWMIYNPLWNNWRRLQTERTRNESGNNSINRNIDENGTISRNGNSTSAGTDSTTITGRSSGSSQRNGESETSGEIENTRTDNLQEEITNNSTTEQSVSAYNSSNYEPREKTVVSGNSSRDNTGTVKTVENSASKTTNSENTSSESNENSNSNSNTNLNTNITESVNNNNTTKDNTTADTNLNITETYNESTEGSIGVITSEDMLQQERNVALFNMYQIIVDDFKQQFCLLLY